MEIRTYTRLWKTPRTFYSLGDISLPRPVSMMTAAIFFAVGLIWVPLMVNLFHLPLGNPFTIILYLGPPAAAAWIGNKPIFEDKNAFEFLMSQVKYLQEPPAWSDLKPEKEVVGTVYINQQRWWTPEARRARSVARKSSRKKRRNR